MAALEMPASSPSQIKPNFFVTATGVHGSFLKSDMDTYLGTIRRMIQQKCGTTQELIQSIRRNKMGDSGHVTPNEFRYTLIKFGVIMPQTLVDKIFLVFDSDRSGTMDFDEFAMWIMNSEFLYREDGRTKRLKDQSETLSKEQLRQKIIVCIKDFPAVFQYMKKSLSFTEFIADVNRKAMGLSEREARAVFLIFDPNDTGFMDTVKLRNWAKSGVLETPPSSAPNSKQSSQRQLPSLAMAINKVCGQNTALLSQAFAHLPKGEGITIPFDEFRRCLLSCGLGMNLFDTKDFYAVLAAGESDGQASIDRLYGSLHVPPRKPEEEVSSKPTRPNFAWTSHAHRRMREAVRKSYKLLKAELEAADRSGSGFVDAQVLHSLLIKHCMPISFQDFRYIVTKFQTEDHGNRVNWQQILAAFLPTKAPHMLDGVAASIPQPVPSAATSSPSLAQASQLLSSRSATSLAAVSSPVHVNRRAPGPEVDDMRAASHAANAKSKGLSLSIKDEVSSKDNDPHSEMRRIWQVVLRECHRSDPDRSGCVSRLAFINALENANLNKTMAPHSMSRLADKYTNPQGLIDYLACFRTYLTAISTKPPPPRPTEDKAPPKTLAAGCHHPWDFDYKRTRSAGPYWSSAASLARDFAGMAAETLQKETVVPPLDKAPSKMTTTELAAIKAKFSPKCQAGCRKLYQTCSDKTWKDLKNDFKSQQVNSQKGCILVTHFYTLLEKYGVKLSKSETHAMVREMRGTGNQDVVKYEEMLRLAKICGKE